MAAVAATPPANLLKNWLAGFVEGVQAVCEEIADKL